MGLVADFKSDEDLLEFVESQVRRHFLERLAPFLEDAACVAYRIPDTTRLSTNPQAELPPGEGQPSVLDTVAPAAALHRAPQPQEEKKAGDAGESHRRRLQRGV